MKHTSGPWIVVEGGPLEGDTVITTQERISGDVIPIVDMDTDYEGEIGLEQQANAKLIAAAPEMLTWLEKLVEEDGILIAREVIAIQALIDKVTA